MFELLLLAYLSYRNSLRAKVKGQNPVLWAFITIAAFLVFMVVGGMVVILAFCKDAVNMNHMSSFDSKQREAAAQQLQQALSANPLHLVTIELFAVGGYLLVRYMLDRKPDKKQPEVHWMDKLGEQ